MNEKTGYVYLQSEPGLYTVGFYAPDGKWHPESDYNTKAEAADRVAHLNGCAVATAVNEASRKKDTYFKFFAHERQSNPYWLEGIICRGDMKIADIGLRRVYGESAEANIAALIGNAEVVRVLKGCIGYLRNLPKNFRPDGDWWKPVNEILEQIDPQEKSDGL